MIIEELYLNGWRSYSEEGITLKKLKKINLLIGPNNVGKSNLLKYFTFLREIFPEGNDTFEEQDVSHYKVNVENRWLYNDTSVECGLTIVECPNHDFFKKTNPEKIELMAVHRQISNYSEFSIVNPSGFDTMESTIFWRHFISNHVRFIGEVRGFIHNKTGDFDVHVDGIKILNFLLEKVHEGDNWIPNYEKKMSLWLKSILIEEELTFNFVAEPTPHFEITVLRGRDKNPLKFQPRQLGTGIAHLVLILTTLHACSHKKMNIFLEEPEMNLHSQSVVALTKILKEEFINHRYFIFTHSNVWLDQIDEDYSVYSFFKNPDNSTRCRNCTENKDFYLLFEKLGIRPSQLLLSNFNIWIEGPSDRIYLNFWINKYSKGTLMEGRHYNFVMYGGTNLSHYDLALEDIINILATGYNTAIICDSDLSETRNSIKNRVTKIGDRIIEKQLQDYAMLWITFGREIENYVPKLLFEQVLSDEPFKKSYILHEGKRAALVLSGNVNSEEYKTTDSYDDFFVYLYKFEEKQLRTQYNELIESEHDFTDLMNKIEEKKKTIFKSISKVEVAKAVVEKWESYEEDGLYDLQHKIIELIERIKKANEV